MASRTSTELSPLTHFSEITPNHWCRMKKLIRAVKAAGRDVLDESRQETERVRDEFRTLFRQLRGLEQLQEAGVELSTRTGASASTAAATTAVGATELRLDQDPLLTSDRPAQLPRRQRGSWVAPAEWLSDPVFAVPNQDDHPAAETVTDSISPPSLPPAAPHSTTEQSTIMDPAQSKNRAAMQGILAMLKGVSSPAQTAKIVSIALGTDSLYSFGELRREPAVEALKDTEHKAWLDVLEIFQYGTYLQYAKQAEELSKSGVTLDEKQQTKLRLATFITLGSTPPITFDSATHELGITAAKEADRILEMSRYFMSAVDEGLINGRLDSRSRKVYIDDIAPLRDVSPSEYANMYATVDSWMSKIDDQLKQVEERSKNIRQGAENRRAEEEEFERRREAADLEASKGRKRGGGAGGDGVDDENAAAASGARNTRAR